MAVLHVKYLLVGGGVASVAAARAIRSLDADGSVLVIGQEVNRPYLRPQLSRRYLRKQITRDELYLDDPNWFVQNHVDLRTGRRVSRIDPPRSAATLDSGEEITYDRLLLATGASAAPLDIPGAKLPNLYTLRTIDDAELLRHAVDQALHEGRPHPNGRGRAAVIGAGLLGVEVAASLTQLGLAVDLIASGEHPWAKQAGEATGRFIDMLLQRHGVRVHAGRRARRLEGDGRVQRIVLDDVSNTVLDCDIAIACIGAIANKELLRNTAIGAGKAILVDSTGQSSAPGVYASGDCCAILDPRFGKHRWLEHWDGAVATATLAGRNMAGAGEVFSALPGFDTEVFGVAMRGWGEARLVDRRLIRGTPNVESPGFAEIGIAHDGRVAQVLVIGDVADAESLRQLVWNRTDVSGKEESLRDPATRI